MKRKVNVLLVTFACLTQFSNVQARPSPPVLCAENDCPDPAELGGSPLVYEVVRPISDVINIDEKLEADIVPDRRLLMQAVAGEYEPGSVIILSDTPMKSVRAEPTDAVSIDGGRVIDRDNIDIKLVKEWYQADQAWYGRYGEKKRAVLVPELLLNDDALVRVDHQTKRNYLRLSYSSGTNEYVSISQAGDQQGALMPGVSEFPVADAEDLQEFGLSRGEPRQLWITVRVPETTEPGLYCSKININHDGNSRLSIPLSVVVLPFALDDPAVEYSIYYRGFLSVKGGTISSERKNETQLRAELANMKEHGVTNPTVYQPYQPLDLFKKYLDIRSRIGFPDDYMYYVGFGAEDSAIKQDPYEYQDSARAVIDTAAEYDIENVFFYGVDEAEGEELLRQKKAWQLLKDIGAGIFVAGYEGTYDAVGDLLDVLIYPGEPNIREIGKFHSAGKKVFNYRNPQSAAENPVIHRRNYGVELWRSRYDGTMNYAYQTSYQLIWNDFDHRYFRDHNYTYPTSSGVVDTIAWEGFREGVDDVRYISTLENRVLELERSGAGGRQVALSEAKEFLEQLRINGAADLDRMRAALISHLVALSGSGSRNIATGICQ